MTILFYMIVFSQSEDLARDFCLALSRTPSIRSNSINFLPIFCANFSLFVRDREW